MVKVGLAASAAIKRKEMDGEGEDREKWPLAPAHQGPKSAEERAIFFFYVSLFFKNQIMIFVVVKLFDCF